MGERSKSSRRFKASALRFLLWDSLLPILVSSSKTNEQGLYHSPGSALTLPELLGRYWEARDGLWSSTVNLTGVFNISLLCILLILLHSLERTPSSLSFPVFNLFKVLWLFEVTDKLRCLSTTSVRCCFGEACDLVIGLDFLPSAISLSSTAKDDDSQTDVFLSLIDV